MSGGNVPKGWEKTQLDAVCTTIYRYPTFYGMEKVEEGVPVVRGEHLMENHSISKNWLDYWFVSHKYAESFPKTRLEIDDIVMSVRGTVGKYSIVDSHLVGAQISPNLIRISGREERVNKKFLAYAIDPLISKLLNTAVQSQALPALSASDLKSSEILLPPLAEQRKIAAILSTWDDSLSTLGKLLDAKRQQKRGLAEALLTGKKRLPGFAGEWERVRLSEVAQRTKGKIVPTNTAGLGVPYIGAKSFGGNFEGFTDSPDAVLCNADDVLILWDGEYAGNSTTGLEGAVSSTVARLRLSESLNAVFLQNQLQKNIQLIRDSRTGSGIPHMPSDFEKWYTANRG